jgi:hypothetical protein
MGCEQGNTAHATSMLRPVEKPTAKQGLTATVPLVGLNPLALGNELS